MKYIKAAPDNPGQLFHLLLKTKLILFRKNSTQTAVCDKKLMKQINTVPALT